LVAIKQLIEPEAAALARLNGWRDFKQLAFHAFVDKDG
jgi:hypothetical protein